MIGQQSNSSMPLPSIEEYKKPQTSNNYNAALSLVNSQMHHHNCPLLASTETMFFKFKCWIVIWQIVLYCEIWKPLNFKILNVVS